jgi:hypothetical protein
MTGMVKCYGVAVPALADKERGREPVCGIVQADSAELANQDGPFVRLALFVGDDFAGRSPVFCLRLHGWSFQSAVMVVN